MLQVYHAVILCGIFHYTFTHCRTNEWDYNNLATPKEILRRLYSQNKTVARKFKYTRTNIYNLRIKIITRWGVRWTNYFREKKKKQLEFFLKMSRKAPMWIHWNSLPQKCRYQSRWICFVTLNEQLYYLEKILEQKTISHLKTTYKYFFI